MRVTVGLVLVLAACTMRGSGKSAQPDFKRYSANVPLRVDSAGSSSVASALIIETKTVFGLQDCLLEVSWHSAGDAQIRVADAQTGSRLLTANKLENTSTGASYKSQNNLDSYSCRRPISVVESSAEIPLVR